MATLENYGGLDVLDAATGDGGMAISENFKRIVDWHPRSVWDETGSPTLNDDESDDPAKNFNVGSLWRNASDGTLYICTDSSPGAARWQLVPYLLSTTSTGVNQPKLSANVDANGKTISNGTFSGTGRFDGGIGVGQAAVASGGLVYYAATNNERGFLVGRNDHTGSASSLVAYWGNSNAGTAEVRLYGTGFTTSGLNVQASFQVKTSSAGGLYLRAEASAPIVLATNGAERARVASNGQFQICDSTPSTGATTAVVKAGANQSTTNLSEWQNSAGGVLTSIGSAGEIISGSTSGTAVVIKTSSALTTSGSKLLSVRSQGNEAFAVGAGPAPSDCNAYFGALDGSTSAPYVRLYAGDGTGQFAFFGSFMNFFGEGLFSGACQTQANGATPTSTATQRDSFPFECKAAVWTGSVAGNHIHQIAALASTTANLQTRLGFTLNRASQAGGTAIEAMSLYYDGSNSTAALTVNGPEVIKPASSQSSTLFTDWQLSAGASIANLKLGNTTVNNGRLRLRTTMPTGSYSTGGDTDNAIEVYDTTDSKYKFAIRPRRAGSGSLTDVHFDPTYTRIFASETEGNAGRIDLYYEQCFFQGTYTYFAGVFQMSRTGDATSLATQKDSGTISFEPSTWTGSAGNIFNRPYLLAEPDLSVADKVRLAVTMRVEGSSATREELFHVYQNGYVSIGTGTTKAGAALEVRIGADTTQVPHSTVTQINRKRSSSQTGDLHRWTNESGTPYSKVTSDGRLVAAAPNSDIPDATLSAAQFSFYLNEGSNTLTVKVKYADGTTIKTGTIALT